MRYKDSWTKICMAIIARKYIVESVTSVRINLDTLCAL